MSGGANSRAPKESRAPMVKRHGEIAFGARLRPDGGLEIDDQHPLGDQAIFKAVRA